ncbi:hypothetical protein VP01_2081g1 [Puccinia sorghi]|uniref:Uncharacterized protein n=1 Tax=Puccinia sorghi TaxID=27349 RepID=A0A0L6VC83_9BASI|nr:hypothetical protein VP01_2081g1 [Puccinia sorghi]
MDASGELAVHQSQILCPALRQGLTKHIGLDSKAALLAPSVLQTTMTEPTIEWNNYRRAKAELCLYLVMNSMADCESNDTEDCESIQRINPYEESETSLSGGDDIPVHFYTPRPLPVIQQLRNWWRYR